MIRPMTFVCLSLAALLGFALFKVKHEVQTLESELTRLHRAILADQESIHVLKAEWSYLNRPRYLEKLNVKFLGLTPVSAERITTIEELPLRNDPTPSVKNTDDSENPGQGLTSPPPHDIRQALLLTPPDVSPAPLAVNSGRTPRDAP